MNPFEVNTKDIEQYFYDWNKLYPKSYNKKETSPFTKVRIILMNGTEFESNWFLHQFARNCDNQDLKRELALVRNQEQQQQKRISCLKPINENMLEETIGYEQLAIDLTPKQHLTLHFLRTLITCIDLQIYYTWTMALMQM